jgi:cytochrome P450
LAIITRHEEGSAAAPTTVPAVVRPDALRLLRQSASAPQPQSTFEQLCQAGPLIRVADRQWLAVGYQTCLRALADRRLGVLEPRPVAADDPGQSFDLSFSQRNGEEHRRLRGVVSPAFASAAVTGMARDIRRQADRLVRAFVADPGLDFVSDVAEALPLATLSDRLGIPGSVRGQFTPLARVVSAATDGAGSPAQLRQLEAACEELAALFTDLLLAGAEPPDHSVLAALRRARVDRISDREAHALLLLMLVAGIATSTQTIANGVLALATWPRQWARLRGDPALVPMATRELLRYACPIMAVRRVVLADTTLDGARLRAGQQVIVAIAVANRDPAAFAAPHEFRVDRASDTVDLAFAYGPHRCLGGRLASLEINALLAALVARVHRLELVDEPSRLSGGNLRGLTRLPLRLRQRGQDGDVAATPG